MDTRSRHLLKVGIMANLFEWYEFFIFVFLSGTLGQLFFKAGHPILDLISAYSIFAISFIARPVGGFFFGLIGDRWGRSISLRLSLILMSVPTILIGLLPTYDHIGWIAPVSLSILRLIQGFAAGGELPMTACYVFESSSGANRGFLCSVIAISPKLGMLAASFVILCLTSYFDEQALLSGAWRIPFLLSIPLTFFIISLRQSISDEKLVKPNTSPIEAKQYQKHLVPIIKATRLVSFGALYFYIMLVWMPHYLMHFRNVAPHIASFNNTATLCMILPLYGLVGYCSKKIGYSRLLFVSFLFMSIAPYFGFEALEGASWQRLLLIQVILALVYVGFDGVLIETLGHLFPAKSRSLSFGVAWSFAAAVVGGTTPLVCTYAIYQTDSLMFPAFYIAFWGILTFPVVLSVVRSETKNRLNKQFI